ncbi:F-box domain-containing protein [Mycena kentingensis (nom. inval.)]|nr:F-box domain-containing protein [Mycena kentingensis (nom. inval.)]
MAQTITDLRLQICRLELEIDRQEANLSAKRSLLCELQSKLARRNPTFPILSLPPEITSEIFVHCLPEELAPANYNKAPFVLLRVCKAWNRVAMSTPALWTKVDLSRLDGRAIQTLECMSKRSGELLLDIRVNGYVPDGFWPLFAENSNRVQFLDVDLSTDNFGCLSACFPVFPVLEYLQLEDYANDQTLHLFNNAPSLRSLHLKNVDLSYMPLPFGNITTLIADIYYIDEIMRVLQALPNLRVLRYEQSEDDEEIHREPVSVFHTGLREVYLCEPHQDQLSVLRYLTLPNLDVLVFEQTAPDMKTMPLQRSLARAKPPLRRMGFRPGPDMRTLSIASMEMFFATPGLAELELAYLDNDSLYEFCDKFTARTGSFLPEIRKLVLRCRYASPREAVKDEVEVELRIFVSRVLDATEYRVVGTPAQPAGPVPPFELRIITEDTDFVGLASLSDVQAAQCRDLKSRGVSLWIGPENRNLVLRACV